MKQLVFPAILVSFLLFRVAPGPGQPPSETEPAVQEDAAHEELRELRRRLVEAVNTNDMEKLMALLDDDVVVTFMNNEVARGPQGVKAYYDRMMTGEDRVVETFATEATVDELTHLYGDTGVAFGSSQDRFRLTDGRDFQTATRWTATLVRADGDWKVAAFHASANMFDNPVLAIAIRRTAAWVGGIAGVLGLAIGFGLGWVVKRRTR
jgi:uncharacterized protein (TIGR02246 family)